MSCLRLLGVRSRSEKSEEKAVTVRASRRCLDPAIRRDRGGRQDPGSYGFWPSTPGPGGWTPAKMRRPATQIHAIRFDVVRRIRGPQREPLPPSFWLLPPVVSPRGGPALPFG